MKRILLGLDFEITGDVQDEQATDQELEGAKIYLGNLAALMGSMLQFPAGTGAKVRIRAERVEMVLPQEGPP